MKWSVVYHGFVGMALSCGIAYADTTYTLDPQESYVSAYVPVWTSLQSNSWTPGPASVDWQLVWQSQRFAVSGSFELAEQPSPYAPDVSHLLFSVQRLQTDAPVSGSIQLPSVLTKLHTDIFDGGFSDPFYPFPGSAMVWSSGPRPFYSGKMEASTLQLSFGLVGAIPPSGVIVAGNSDGPVISIPQEQIEQASRLYSFSIVAQPTLVPEPSVWVMMAAGLLSLIAMTTRIRYRTLGRMRL